MVSRSPPRDFKNQKRRYAISMDDRRAVRMHNGRRTGECGPVRRRATVRWRDIRNGDGDSIHPRSCTSTRSTSTRTCQFSFDRDSLPRNRYRARMMSKDGTYYIASIELVLQHLRASDDEASQTLQPSAARAIMSRCGRNVVLGVTLTSEHGMSDEATTNATVVRHATYTPRGTRNRPASA